MEPMAYPMQCMRCLKVHDASNVTVLQRYSDCSTWRCPHCKSLIDDRPIGWGGSAKRVDGDYPVDMRSLHVYR